MTAPGASKATAALIQFGSLVAHSGTGWWKFRTPESGFGGPYAIHAGGAWQVWDDNDNLWHSGTGWGYDYYLPWNSTVYVYAEDGLEIGMMLLEWGEWEDPPEATHWTDDPDLPTPLWYRLALSTVPGHRNWAHTYERTAHTHYGPVTSEDDEGFQPIFDSGEWAAHFAEAAAMSGISGSSVMSFSPVSMTSHVDSNESVARGINYHFGELGVPIDYTYYDSYETTVRHSEGDHNSYSVWGDKYPIGLWDFGEGTDRYDLEWEGDLTISDVEMKVEWTAEVVGGVTGSALLRQSPYIMNSSFSDPTVYDHTGVVLYSFALSAGDSSGDSGWFNVGAEADLDDGGSLSMKTDLDLVFGPSDDGAGGSLWIKRVDVAYTIHLRWEMPNRRWRYQHIRIGPADPVIGDPDPEIIPVTVVRQYPRDDQYGLGSAPRLYPPPSRGRVVGGLQ